MRSTTYITQAQVCQRLDIADAKTLKQWCSQANPPIESRKRKTFGNTAWYTEGELRQLERIAEQHGRRVRKFEGGAEEEKELPQSEDRPDGEVNQDQLEHLSSLEQKVHRLELKLKNLQREVEEVFKDLSEGESLQTYLDRYLEKHLARLSEASPDEFSQVNTSPQGEVRGHRAPIQGASKLDGDGSVLAKLSTLPRKTYERGDKGEGKRPDPSNLRTWTESELFQENWLDPEEGQLVSKARMINAHNVPDSNVRRDVEKQKILEMLRLNICYDGVWRKGAFNAEQRRQFFLLYSGQSWFKPCELCNRNGHEAKGQVIKGEG